MTKGGKIFHQEVKIQKKKGKEMTYGKLVRWGNGLKVVQAGKSEEELGEINKQHNWVIEQRDIPIGLDDRISFGELKDFGIIQEPTKE